MKSMKKTLMLVICALALITTSVFGTLAYLTDQAEVVNTFTVGNVSITLDETVVLPDGTPVDEDEDGTPDRAEKGNEYHLIPGKEYTKDPVITVVAGSEPAFIRTKVIVSDFADVKALIGKYIGENRQEALEALVNCLDLNSDDWSLDLAGIKEDEENDTATLEFRYNEVVAGVNDQGEKEDVKLPALFTKFTVPAFVTADDLATLDEFKITVIGEAMQASGFDAADPTGAWAEFDAQGANATESTPAPAATASPTMAPPAVNP